MGDRNEGEPPSFDDVFGEGAERKSARKAVENLFKQVEDLIMDSNLSKTSSLLTPAENQERLRLLQRMYRPHPKGGYSLDPLEPEELERLERLNRKAGL